MTLRRDHPVGLLRPNTSSQVESVEQGAGRWHFTSLIALVLQTTLSPYFVSTKRADGPQRILILMQESRLVDFPGAS
jgi:hypothetical protein